MSKHEVTIGMTQEIKELMYVEGYASESTRIAEFIAAKGERFSYDRENNRYFINTFYPSFPSKAWNRLIIGGKKMVKKDVRVPLQADIVVTGKCHCRCWHCFRIKAKRDDLTLEEIKKTIDELYEMGTLTVGITGGEPMLRGDIRNIIEMIPDGIEGQLYTTGHNITNDFARFLKTTNLTRVIISLDHYEEEMANGMRNYNNAFNEAISAIRCLVDEGIYTAVTVCITERLLEEGKLKRYFDYVKNLGINEIRIVLPIPQGNLESENRREIANLYIDAIRFVKNIKKEYANKAEYPQITNFCEFESASYMGCAAGANYISINNDDLVTPCVAVPLSFGNIRENSLKEIFNDMGKYFPRSGKVCYGKTSGKIIQKKKINTDITPISERQSKEVASECIKSESRAAIFDCFVS